MRHSVQRIMDTKNYRTFAVLAILFAIPVTLYVALQSQDVRNRAQETSGGVTASIPFIAITDPTNGERITGNTTIKTQLQNDADVTAVEFYINKTMRTVVKKAPYAYQWNSDAEAPGNYIITVRAYNTSGKSSSASITVTK